MKKILLKESPQEILVDMLVGNEPVAYRCHNSENFAVLARLRTDGRPTESYGFIPLGDSNNKPRYVADSWFDAVRLAARDRKLYVFNSTKEMITAIANNKF